ncbi:hypothetical protein [Amphiplicatus metriothermophilus]|uniref:Uncharacterized protein n=1 Tax=Amphiplicatus metriothermophilus TaxID=1519374 RepID=A0A239PP73_9PROT|nr:hypothetical protein [Amphiplicatus metriothermophilus]MBB5518780.1 hypothetical protein [Amphiplicatus metriothermophilus]SNT72065.1 hypothetical protein SAMN06297382_1096 [Amphiplicatus metriothermophilus]
MARNWGLPPRPEQAAIRRARRTRPFATLSASAIFGVIGAAVAAFSFAEARDLIENVFHGRKLILAIVAGGVGCWTYVWLARPRFAAHFTGDGDAFADLVRFYARAGLTLGVVLALAAGSRYVVGDLLSVALLCISGGAGAAAAFQTVLAFVPDYRDESA